LSEVSEAAGVVDEEPWGVVVTLDGRLAQEGKGLVDLDVVRHLPFVPDSLVGLPSAPRHGALEEAMLRGFFGVGVVDFASRSDAHDLKPGSHWEALVEGQPDECAHLAWARVMPYPGDQLSGCSVPEIEALEECHHIRGVG